MVSILFESLRKSRPFADVIITWLLKARLFCRKPRLSWSSPSSRPSRGCWSIAGPSRLSSRLLTILFCHSFGRSSSSCISTAQDRSMGMVSSVVGNRFLPLPCSAALCSHTVTWEWESFPGSEPPSFPVSHLLDWTFSEFRVSWGSSRFITPIPSLVKTTPETVRSLSESLWSPTLRPLVWPWWGLFEGTCVASVCVLSRFSRAQLFATPWTVPSQAPLSIGFSRQEHWSKLPCPSPGDLPDPGIKSMALASPALGDRFFTTHAPTVMQVWTKARTCLGWPLLSGSSSVFLLHSHSLNSPSLKHTDGDSSSLLFSTDCKFKKRFCL